MKKTIFFLMAIMASIAIFADKSETAAFQINVLVSGAEVDNIYLTEDTSYTYYFDNGYDALKFTAGSDTLIYSYLGDTALSVVARPCLVGTLITFKANNATTYTLSVAADVAKDGMRIKDNKTQLQYDLADGTEFEFTQDANSIYLNRFEIVDTATDNQTVAATPVSAHKTIVSGQLIIIRDDKTYTTTGTELSDLK